MKLKRLKRSQTIDAYAEVDTDGTWAISYGDLVTLLLVFFILFSLLSSGKKKQTIDTSLLATLAPLKTENVNIQDFGIAEKMKFPGGDTKDMGTGEGSFIAKWGANLIEAGNRIVVDFPQISFFNSGKTELTREGEKQLQMFVKSYVPFTGKYLLGIRAYTDDRAVSSQNPRFKDNLELSALRSIAAMKVLQKAGIPLHRMRLGGYGELKRTAEIILKDNKENEQEQLRAFSRKVVLVIEPEVEQQL